MDLRTGVDDQIARVTDRLVKDFRGRVPDVVVRDLVSEEYGPYRDARVMQFVPVLVDRSVRQRLRRTSP